MQTRGTFPELSDNVNLSRAGSRAGGRRKTGASTGVPADPVDPPGGPSGGGSLPVPADPERGLSGRSIPADPDIPPKSPRGSRAAFGPTKPSPLAANATTLTLPRAIPPRLDTNPAPVRPTNPMQGGPVKNRPSLPGGLQSRAARARRPYEVARDPFAVNISPERKQTLCDELCWEIESERQARSSIIDPGKDLDYYRQLYEGGDRKLTKNFPWPGAANLTSWLGTESVDATRARIVQTVFADPVWVVDGWGEAAQRAPFVEAFHQWKVEEEKLQRVLTRTIQTALLEGTGILEVFERPLLRRIKRRMKAKAQLDPITRGIRVDERNTPIPERDEFGDLVEADETSPAIDLVTNDVQKLRKGPQYRVISLRDFVYLPGTAQDPADVWGYAKRVWKRVGDLKTEASHGVYDKEAVKSLDEADETEDYPHISRTGQDVPNRMPGAFAQKELYELSVLLDLDGDGIEEWYLLTVHLRKRIMLRITRDDLNHSRFLGFRPFPRADSLYGYTLIEKIVSIIEEHTSIRNASADRSTLANAAPVTRVHGAPWNPYLVPWGPLAVIDVRDHNDVQQMRIADVPGSMNERERGVIAAKERVMGLSDSSLGVHPQVDRTLGEVQLVNLQSAVRVEEIVKNVQETMEDLFSIRHEIWKRTLAQDEKGEQLPSSLLQGLETRGAPPIPGDRATAAMLAGTFRGKPHGSVDNADLTKMRGDFNGFLQALGQLAQNSPMVAQVLGAPEIIKMIMTQAMRVYRWQDRFTLNAAIAQVTASINQQMQMQQQMAAQGQVAPGQPPGPVPPGQPGQGAPSPAPQLPAGPAAAPPSAAMPQNPMSAMPILPM